MFIYFGSSTFLLQGNHSRGHLSREVASEAGGVQEPVFREQARGAQASRYAATSETLGKGVPERLDV